MNEARNFYSSTAPVVQVRCSVRPLSARPTTHSDDRRSEAERLWSDPLLREAVWLASPILAEQADALAEGKELRKKNLRKLHQSLIRYAIRISSRPTPFGLFAGVSAANFGSGRLALDHVDNGSLDVHRSFETTSELRTSGEATIERLVVAVNASVYRDGNRIVIPVSTGTGSEKINEMRDLQIQGPLETVLRLAQEPVAVPTLIDSIRSEYPDAPAPVIGGFVSDLLDHGLLVSHYFPSPFSRETVRSVGEFVSQEATHAIASFANSRRGSIGADALADARQAIEVSGPKSLHVDLHMPIRGNVPESVSDTAQEVLDTLVATSCTPNNPPYLQAHADRFVERFGDVAVPLLTALDPIRGIGLPRTYPSSRINSGSDPAIPVPVVHKNLRARLIERAARAGQNWVEITDDDLRSLPVAENPPTSADLFLNLSGAPDSPVVSVAAVGVNFPAGRGSGRFAHHSPALRAHLEDCVRHDQATHPNTLLCEIDYISPRSAVNNVSRCPTMYSAVLTTIRPPASFADDTTHDDVLTLDDLYVCVADSLLQLRTKNGQRVLARRATMVSPETANDVIRFVEEVSMAGVDRPVWDWAGLDEMFDFVPEVRRRGAVLSPAKRRMPKSVASATDPHEEFLAWAEEVDLPTEVNVGQMDNLLRLDVSDHGHRELLFKEARTGQRELKYLPQAAGHGGGVESAHGTHATEIVISVFSEHSDTRAAGKTVPNFDASAENRFSAPGAQWWYFELHCEQADHAAVLSEVSSSNEFPAGDWFFVRYHEERSVLRVRVRSAHADPASLCDVINGLRERRLISDYSIKPYIRELERYGGDRVLRAAEELFCAESAFIATNSALCAPVGERDKAEYLRSLPSAVAFVEEWFKSTSMSTDDMEAVVDFAVNGYRFEFADEDSKLRKAIHGLDEPTLDSALVNLFHAACGDRARRLFDEASANISDSELPDFWQTMTHMLCNRLGYSRKREYQIILAIQARLRTHRLAEKGVPA